MGRLILLTILVLGPTAASAENGLFYLGAGVTHSSLTVAINNYVVFGNIPTDLKNHSWTAFAGVRPLKWLAAEAEYIDLGSGNLKYPEFTISSSTLGPTHGNAWAVYAVGFLPVPLPVVEFYGKLGVARWKLNSTFTTYSNDSPP